MSKEGYYLDYSENEFVNTLNKYEFKNTGERNYLYQDSRQLLMRNIISKNTIYDNILLYWNTGRGKTSGSISIAEGFKEYVANMGRTIVVLVKNGNIERNFRNELISNVTRNEYIDENTKDLLKSGNLSDEHKKEIFNKINRKINKIYTFITYGSFVNQVLGTKVFNKDELGTNTKVQQKVNGVGVRKKTGVNTLTNFNNSVVIVDEAHNVTNNVVYDALEKVLKASYNYRLVLLTATPMYDNPKEIIEISNLLNMNHKENILPIRNNLFKPHFNQSILVKQSSLGNNSNIVKGDIVKLTDYGKDLLSKTLKGKISYFESDTATFPSKIEMGFPLTSKEGSIKVVSCQMSDYQNSIYKSALKLDLNINDSENDENVRSSSLYKNSSDASTISYPKNLYGKSGFTECFKQGRKPGDFVLKPEYKGLLTTDLSKYSKKLFILLQNIKESEGTVFVYSNYVNYGGTSLVKQLLINNGYHEFSGKNDESRHYKSFIMYDDTTTVEKREKHRKILNHKDNKDGKFIKIIIGSPVISEGITLKNIRQVHILEPSWNMSRINQIIGRAVRHYSHIDLDATKRNVKIFKYCSVNDDSSVGYIDKQKYILSEDKDRANKEVERHLKQIAFDCNINTKTKQHTTANSAECDYTDCEYKCMMQPNTIMNDTSTYNMYIDFFEKYDIEYCTYLIKQMFKEYFVWSIDDILSRINFKESSISKQSVYTSLMNLTENKNIVSDSYNRDGFIIQKNEYFIFNPMDKDISTSIFSKLFDFNVNVNKYSLAEFSEKVLNETIDTFDTIKTKDKNKIKKQNQDTNIITQDIIQYNENLLTKKVILGTYRERGTKQNKFGPTDGKFRIIDLRNTIDDGDDKRKNISGMAIISKKKAQLIEMIKYMNVSSENIKSYLKYPSDNIDILKLDTTHLATIVEKYLNENNLVLK